MASLTPTTTTALGNSPSPSDLSGEDGRNNDNYDVAICNFRDAGGLEVWFDDTVAQKRVHGWIKTRTFFRSSSIDRASSADAHLLIDKLKIRSLIDLRTAEFSGLRGVNLERYYPLAHKVSVKHFRKENKKRRGRPAPLPFASDLSNTSSSELPGLLSPSRGEPPSDTGPFTKGTSSTQLPIFSPSSAASAASSAAASSPLSSSAAVPIPSPMTLTATVPSSPSTPPATLAPPLSPFQSRKNTVDAASAGGRVSKFQSPAGDSKRSSSKSRDRRSARPTSQMSAPDLVSLTASGKKPTASSMAGGPAAGPLSSQSTSGSSAAIVQHLHALNEERAELSDVSCDVEFFRSLRVNEVGDDSADNFGGPVGPDVQRGRGISMVWRRKAVEPAAAAADVIVLPSTTGSGGGGGDTDDDDVEIDTLKLQRMEGNRWRAASVVAEDDDLSEEALQQLLTPDELIGPAASSLNCVAGAPGQSPSSSSLALASAVVAAAAPFGTCYRHGLVGKEFRSAIIASTPKKALGKAAKAYMLGRGPAAYRKAIVGPLFNAYDGVERLYHMFIDYCQAEIACCLINIASSAAMPFVVYCNHGKDRTGLICALIHYVCGVPLDAIVQNYTISDEKLEPIAHLTEEEMKLGGLDPSVLCRSPAKAMEGTFSYIVEQWGSVDNYLDDIGFTYEYQNQLRNKLVDTVDVTSLGSTVPVPVEAPIAAPADSVLFRPDADADGHVALVANQPLLYTGQLEPGSYQLSVEGVDLWADAANFVHVMFALGAVATPDYRVLTAMSIHQSSTTTIVRPFVVADHATAWSLSITGATLAAAGSLNRVRTAIRPFPAPLPYYPPPFVSSSSTESFGSDSSRTNTPDRSPSARRPKSRPGTRSISPKRDILREVSKAN